MNGATPRGNSRMMTMLNQNPSAVEKGAVQKESNAGWATGLAGGIY